MGAWHDKEASTRRLDADYVLTTAEGVEAFLESWYKFERADYGVVDMILDFKTALTNAELTEKQLMAINLVYVQGYTMEEVSGIEECTESAIKKRLSSAVQKIVDVYRYWQTMEVY